MSLYSALRERYSGVARQRLQARHRESNGQMENSRPLSEYLTDFKGMFQIFDTVKSTESLGNRILFIGEGNGVAVSQLVRQTNFAAGLDIHATVLSRNTWLENILGKGNVHTCSVETLKGIPDNSIGAIFSDTSVAYSADSSMAVESMDRVLRSNGIVKLTFYNNPKGIGTFSGFGTHHEFTRAFLEKGYDTFVDETGNFAVLTAVKNGESDSAMKIFERDRANCSKQLIECASQLRKFYRPRIY